jgi:hypothetical protein
MTADQIGVIFGELTAEEQSQTLGTTIAFAVAAGTLVLTISIIVIGLCWKAARIMSNVGSYHYGDSFIFTREDMMNAAARSAHHQHRGRFDVILGRDRHLDSFVPSDNDTPAVNDSATSFNGQQGKMNNKEADEMV